MATDDARRDVERAQRGDEAGCAALYRRYRPSVLHLLSSFSGLDHDDHQDLVQETFERAFRRVPQLRAPAAFEAWLYAIARNRALTRLERKTWLERVRAELSEEVEAFAPPLPEALQAELDEAVVRDFIERLPDGPEKRTVTLYYLEGELCAREIAEKLGVGKSAITMRLERFRTRVKGALAQSLARAHWD